MATQDNLSAVLLEKGNLKLEQRPMPAKLGPNDVLIRIHSVGICGSDVHYWVNGCIGDFIVRAPMVLGHETSGVVAQVGSGVKHLKQGDRVAIEPGVPCRMCQYCKHGQYNLCPDMGFCATPPYDGTLTRYFAHPADFCYKLPDHVSFEEGAMLEPLSVAVQACRRANITFGENVLICGAGPIGLVNLLTAKAQGAAKVCITDIDEHRLSVAKSLGADFTYRITKKDVRGMAEDIANLFGGHRFGRTRTIGSSIANCQCGRERSGHSRSIPLCELLPSGIGHGGQWSNQLETLGHSSFQAGRDIESVRNGQDGCRQRHQGHHQMRRLRREVKRRPK
jgi:L-iditol 2-dehydrogenase